VLQRTSPLPEYLQAHSTPTAPYLTRSLATTRKSPGIQHRIVMVVAIAEVMKRPPGIAFWLIEAAASRN